MTEGNSPKETMSQKLGKLFKTDIPPMVHHKRGHTVKTKNFAYVSGPSEWNTQRESDQNTLISSNSSSQPSQHFVVARRDENNSGATPADVFFTVERSETKNQDSVNSNKQLSSSLTTTQAPATSVSGHIQSRDLNTSSAENVSFINASADILPLVPPKQFTLEVPQTNHVSRVPPHTRSNIAVGNPIDATGTQKQVENPGPSTQSHPGLSTHNNMNQGEP